MIKAKDNKNSKISVKFSSQVATPKNYVQKKQLKQSVLNNRLPTDKNRKSSLRKTKNIAGRLPE